VVDKNIDKASGDIKNGGIFQQSHGYSFSSDGHAPVKAKGCIWVVSQDTLTYFRFSLCVRAEKAMATSAVNMNHFVHHLKNLVFLVQKERVP